MITNAIQDALRLTGLGTGLSAARCGVVVAVLAVMGMFATPAIADVSDIFNDLGGVSSDDTLGAHTVQEGVDEEPLSDHTVQEGRVEPPTPDWGNLSPIENLALELGFVEATANGGFTVMENWLDGALFHYDMVDLMPDLIKIDSWLQSHGTVSAVTVLMADPRSYMEDLMTSGATIPSPNDTTLITSVTADIPTPGAIALLALAGLGLRSGRRRDTHKAARALQTT